MCIHTLALMSELHCSCQCVIARTHQISVDVGQEVAADVEVPQVEDPAMRRELNQVEVVRPALYSPHGDRLYFGGLVQHQLCVRCQTGSRYVTGSRKRRGGKKGARKVCSTYITLRTCLRDVCCQTLKNRSLSF